jgi:nitroreductase
MHSLYKLFNKKGISMDTLEAIHTRRSIRKYTNIPVSQKNVREILAAAMQAPSSSNQQSWQFLVIDEPHRLKEYAEANPYAKMAAQATLGILVCGDLSSDDGGYWVQDCSAAMQNLLLAAHVKGVGAVWTGIYPDEESVEKYSAMFELPSNIVPLGLAVMGYPAQNPSHVNRYSEAKVHWNRW